MDCDGRRERKKEMVWRGRRGSLNSDLHLTLPLPTTDSLVDLLSETARNASR